MLIKTRADYIKALELPVFKYSCSKCHKGIPKEEKVFYKGFCEDCRDEISANGLCIICFEKIHGLKYNRDVNICCYGCNHKGTGGDNSHGFKESSTIDGKRNFWTDNENDNLMKIIEG